VVIDRRRLTTIDPGLPTLPYHHESLSMPEDDANALIARVRDSIERRTSEALGRLVGDLAPTYKAVALAIREPPFAALPASVVTVRQSYRLQCAADGIMYQLAMCAAARALGLEVEQCRRGDEFARAGARLHVSAEDVAAFVDRAGRPSGPPWTAEHRRAYAAGIAALAGRSTARILLPGA
jgi:hypothetical protein